VAVAAMAHERGPRYRALAYIIDPVVAGKRSTGDWFRFCDARIAAFLPGRSHSPRSVLGVREQQTVMVLIDESTVRYLHGACFVNLAKRRANCCCREESEEEHATVL
jgi:hypothetical protein